MTLFQVIFCTSAQSIRLPLDIITGTTELIHSVCSLTFASMPSCTSLFNSALHADCMDTWESPVVGVELGVYCSFILMWYEPEI